ncbi:MAG TPA: hypothetical protein PK331_00065 [Gordonia sp. (in: high G+C Gram-positive bacteria)]|uniref:hypothetical protein n=1 Tax=unclassified Gordonia (in: high G+C Gram-positive bacteria) TaxID=2657482 RepID=UPI000FA09FA1|nr:MULTISPECIES: hypothetical protein [unclassified Gordonia (in: high G+C Gram-positive bacteria)]RUP40285.1 MAG: hypothetical protein EKK60_04350 [Gordonia sp. (in: high G+C Gram-positive bacteria)]HNP57239.1 hypothetical protein [Gordonia sp. (in: high G+C Gram-positive bacteria)]HRC49303.1 hypothetical protein [Gordonia sp. (in: high G+C Gram-positive bacteria)]
MDGLLTKLGAVLTGPPDGRQRELDVLWAQIDADDHAARCIAAHYIADAQGDLDAEVGWDETSLTEVALTCDDELQAIHPTLSVAGFLPSLHLNLADGYRRQGRFTEAADQLRQSREFDFALNGAADPSYSAGIRTAQAELAAKIASDDRT